MDKNLFMAIGLSMAVIIGYYAFFPPQPTPERPAEPQELIDQEFQFGAGTAPRQSALSGDGASPAPRLQDSAVSAQQVLTVETPLYVALIDRRGGKLISLRLKNYRVSKSVTDWGDLIPPLRALLSKNDQDQEAIMEMVSREIAGSDFLGVEFVEDRATTEEFQQILFQSNRDGLTLTADAIEPQSLILTGSTLDGLTLRKSLTFHPDSYVIEYDLQVINYGNSARNLRVQALFGEGPTGDGSDQFRSHRGPIFQEDGSVDTETADDIEDRLLVPEFDWLGMTDNYFLSAVSTKTPVSHGIYRSVKLPARGDDERWGAFLGIELPAVSLQAGKMVTGQFLLYAGPKKVEEMRKFDDQLENSLDLTLDILATPLLAMLRWFHGYAGNYGVAIILLTIVVRVGLFPLTYKGMVAMKRMQKLQPRVKALREKYKGDKERINKEMMGMYKRFKINPLGGCLPIAAQIPIFFALYSALLGAIELRHSPFTLWITDLSAMDPLYITPLLMGGSMFLQQRLTPTTLDPTQAKIMMWMPVVFTAFMFNFPSGLVLYWLTSNILSVAQQLIINRINVPEPEEQTEG